MAILVAFTALMYSEYTQESTFTGDSRDFAMRINGTRYTSGIPVLKMSTALDTVAQRKCNDMVTRKYNAHKDPDGKYIWDYAPQGYKYGENLAGGFKNSDDVIDHWLASPEHLENIVDPVFTEVGHATCKAGNQWLVVEVFKS